MLMRPIGVIRSPFTDPAEMPVQPTGAAGIEGTVEVLPEFVEGLKDLDGFSHVVLLYLFDRSVGYEMTVVPFMDETPRGLFSTRAPRRPNPIGLSVVRLRSVVDRTLHVEGVDVLDMTPLLDIKPFVSYWDAPNECRNGWLEGLGEAARQKRSDDRFT